MCSHWMSPAIGLLAGRKPIWPRSGAPSSAARAGPAAAITVAVHATAPALYAVDPSRLTRSLPNAPTWARNASCSPTAHQILGCWLRHYTALRMIDNPVWKFRRTGLETPGPKPTTTPCLGANLPRIQENGEARAVASIFGLGGRPAARSISTRRERSSRRPRWWADRRRAAGSVVMALSGGEDFRRPTTLALAGLALIGWLLAAYLWSEASRTESEMTESLRAAAKARRVPCRRSAEPSEGRGDRSRSQGPGDRSGEGAVRRLGRARFGAERPRRPDQADQRRPPRRLRSAGGSQRPDARSAVGRR